MWQDFLRVLRLAGGRPQPPSRFLARFTGKTVIVHTGLRMDWLEELLRQGGGGAHFRLDARIPPSKPPTPAERVVHRFVLPLGLPLPLLLQVERNAIRVRHLLRHGGTCPPADIGWILDDMRERGRVHATLHADGEDFRVVPGIPPEDNAVETPYGET